MTKRAARVLGLLSIFAAVFGLGTASISIAAPNSTLIVGTTQVASGDTISIPMTIDSLPTGLTGYDIDIEVANPAIAVITGVIFSSVFVLTSDSIESDGSGARVIGVDLGSPGLVGPGDTGVELVTLRVQGLVEGVTSINVTLNRMDDDEGNVIAPALVSGSVQVLNSPQLVNAGPDVVVNLGDNFIASGQINDPGDSAWTGTVDYGDGTSGPLTTTSGTSFSLNHDYQVLGLYIVTVDIFDDDSALGTDTIQVQVSKVYPVLPGLVKPAQDLDGDGLAEDISGNGRLDFDDVVKLFKNVSSQVVTDNYSDFDFNDNGFMDMDDIVQLFMILVSKFG